MPALLDLYTSSSLMPFRVLSRAFSDAITVFISGLESVSVITLELKELNSSVMTGSVHAPENLDYYAKILKYKTNLHIQIVNLNFLSSYICLEIEHIYLTKSRIFQP